MSTITGYGAELLLRDNDGAWRRAAQIVNQASYSFEQVIETARQASEAIQHAIPGLPAVQPLEEWPEFERCDDPAVEPIHDTDGFWPYMPDYTGVVWHWARTPVAVSNARMDVLSKKAGEHPGSFDLVEPYPMNGIPWRSIHCQGPRLWNNIENELAARYKARGANW